MSSNGKQIEHRGALKGKIIFLGFLIGVVSLVYVAQMFSLQIVQGFEFKDKATQVSRRTIPIPAPRGEIYDRNMDVPIAFNIDAYAVDVIPAEVPKEKMKELKIRLAEALLLSVETVDEKLAAETYNLYRPVEITNDVKIEQIFKIAERIGDFPGVTWQKKPIRHYPETGSIAHVLGFVGDLTVEELQVLYNEDYRPDDIIGKSGVEKIYDLVLRGKNGERYRVVDAKGRRIEESEIDIIEPEIGSDIVLTIDRYIQKLCEKALKGRIGSVVVLKPATGEILALVSSPWYDSNFVYSDKEGQIFKDLSLNPASPFINRALQSTYAPASTFKIIMSAALLEEEAINPSFQINCTGSLQVGDRAFRCWEEKGHGPVDLKKALAKSCDVYFYTAGLEHLGIEIISDYMRMFGFGELSGIDLPSEKKGIAPDPAWKEKVKNTRWVGGDTVNTSIGQGFTLVTPLQLANAVAMIANRGVVYVPHLLKEIRDPVSGELLEENKPKILLTSAIQKSTFDIVQEMMRGVITEGTARYVVTTKAVDVAGKTGTGEVGKEENWNSWFVAYAPFGGNPEEMVVVAVMDEATNEWEWWAPKAANIILQGIFADQNFDEALEALRVRHLFE